MLIWRRAWMLTWQGWRRLLLPAVVTLLFTLTAGLLVGSSIQGSPEALNEGRKGVETFAINLLVLSLVPNLGFILSKDYLTYHLNDIFSRRLAFYLRMPIRHTELVLSRFILMGTCITVFSIPFYVLLYWASSGLGDEISLSTYLQVAILWWGTSLLVNALYIYLELGYTGKGNLLGCFLCAATYVLISIALAFGPYSISDASVYAVRHIGWAAPLLGVIIGAAGVYVGFRTTVNRLRRRDLA